MRVPLFSSLAPLLFASICAAQSGGIVGAGVPAFEVRKGYKVTLAAENIGAPKAPVRFIEIDDKGVLYVSMPTEGRVISVRDKDGDGVFETKADFITGYKQVHSMHFFGGWLYATSSADGSCKRARDTNEDGVADDIEDFLPANSVPAGGGHAYRGICVTDKFVYVSVSDPSNMTEELPSERKSIYRFDRDGKNRMQFATGIRNTEKLRIRPGTDELYGVDHGSDNFGKTYGESKNNQPITDLLPGEELNLFVEGGFYGHPFISNNRIVRPEFARREDIVELAGKTIPPAWVFGAHWAGNGFTFLTHDHFPGHKGDMLVAFHGSWNSSARVGYRIERVLFDTETGKPYGSQRIVGTFDGEKILARPVDCVEAPDGSVLFSCDWTQKVYRISKAE